MWHHAFMMPSLPPQTTPTRSRGIRLSQSLDREIQSEAKARNLSWSAMGTELLEEAIRIRRAPGIVFGDGPTGRRAMVAGTGLDVWEVIATWKSVGQDLEALTESYPALTQPQLRAAIGYYELYPEEIEVRLEREDAWTPERVRRELPFATPRR
jgi:uncharacterized protein (DUF433 family)